MTSVKVSNVSLGATDRDLKEFFSFSGDIIYLETQSETEQSKSAYVTFKDLQGAETAVLLSGATIVDSSVIVAMAPDYQLSPEALASLEPKDSGKSSPRAGESVLRKAEDVVSSMLAKGFILGKDAIAKAKSVDEKHQLTSTASAKVTSLTDKINTGTVVVGEKVREVDQKYQVSEKTKSAMAAAEQTVSNAGSAIMKNRYILTGATWVTGAFNKVAKAAEEVGQKAKEKVGMAEEEEEKKKVVDELDGVHLSESSPKTASSPKEVTEKHEDKLSESSEAKKESEHHHETQPPPVQQSPPPLAAPAQPQVQQSTPPVVAAPAPAQP
ncbi:unnamed protein product [Cochlearia groenlandica]